MAVEIRPALEPEMGQFAENIRYAFASDLAIPVRPEWSLCAFVDGTLATTFAAWPLTVRWNGTALRVAGVTCVSTAPEHRRRGLLRAVMERSFREQRESGLSIAILWASMAAIYQRYGYGPVTRSIGYTLDPRRVALLDSSRPAGSTERIASDEILAAVKPIYIAHVADRTLALHRASATWEAGPLHSAAGQPIHATLYRDAGGDPRGYVIYETHGPGKVPGAPSPPNQRLAVRDLAALDAEAHRALWQHLLCHDLVCQIDTCALPADDPTPLLVQEPRELGRHTRDGVWMRVVDVERALGSRPLGASGELVIQIRNDELCPWNDGSYHLESGSSEVSVRRTGRGADLVLPPRTLAPLLSGTHSASALLRAGLLDAKDPETLARADRMFATTHTPHCTDTF